MDDILDGNVPEEEVPVEAAEASGDELGAVAMDEPVEAVEQPAESMPEPMNGLTTEEEHETIRAWKAKQAEALAERDAKAESDNEELKKQAAEELSKWKAEHAKGISDREASNKEDEASFIQQRDNAAPGSEWERVAFHVDFNVKSNRNEKDVSRMRSILLQVKQHGIKSK
eukprot:m.4125 g.4125  ORF g.4125 m.4125 type:complete len:171 (-) comp6723_c0_seq1:2477-2989(-)